MCRKFTIFARIFTYMHMRKYILFLLITLGLTFQGFAQTTKDNKSDSRLDAQQYLEIMGAAINTLQRHYVDSIDWAKVMTAGIDAMLETLDPYTEFYREEDTEEFKTMTTGEYAGIGALIQQNGDTVIIANPYEGKPAQLAGIKPGDAILKIDGESMLKKTTSQVSEKLRGQSGSEFQLTVLRPFESEPRTVSITRKKIVMSVVPYAGWLNDSIAYIALSQFTDKAAIEVQDALLGFKADSEKATANGQHKSLRGLVFDLRDNPGGLLEEAVKIVGMFVRKGSVVVTQKAKLSEWDSTNRTSTQPIDTTLHIAVMIDRGSASASEIVTGALQDMDRAVVVGERSFGKGLVQNSRPLPYNTLMKFTSAKYYTPSGRCVQAIDYSHRNPDGSVGRIPDSLTHVFHTMVGRPVRDGGGITPDIQLPVDTASNLEYYLVAENLLFKYATYFAHKNESLRDLTDEDYADFKSYVMANRKDTVLKALKIDLSHDMDSLRTKVQNRLLSEVAMRYQFEHGQNRVTVENDVWTKKAVEILQDEAEYNKILAAPVEEKKSAAKKSKAVKSDAKKKK